MSPLEGYKRRIDEDITEYVAYIQRSTLQQYGPHAQATTRAFTDLLLRGGKRIRGALTMVGYEMSGGTNDKMIVQAARVIEMLHTYVLMIDDIQDRSVLRRGGPTAHVMLADYHRQNNWAGDSEHLGVSLALNAALTGAHAAQMIAANLDASAEDRTKVLSIINRTMVVTAHGQTHDLINQVVPRVSKADIDQVEEWKTATYSFLNPLHVGMVLAGADCHATDAITPYAKHVGHAYQITDDIVGMFGLPERSGKNPTDDIREGKRNILTIYALQHATKTDQKFLTAMLGNPDITPAQFARCQDIITTSGALDHAKSQAQAHVKQALASLQTHQARWSPQGIQFLTSLAHSIATRST